MQSRYSGEIRDPRASHHELLLVWLWPRRGHALLRGRLGARGRLEPDVERGKRQL
jgi:hypothetical protein